MKYILIVLSFLFVSIAGAAEVDTKNSEFDWYASKVTGDHYGKVMLGESMLIEKDGKVVGGEFIMDMTTLTVENIDSPKYEKKFLNHMKSDDFFDVAKYPTATLKINKIEGTNVEGDLTIKDKTNPINFTMEQNGDLVTGKMKFDRTKYDMIYNSGNFFKDLGDKMIHDEVVLTFNVKVIES